MDARCWVSSGAVLASVTALLAPTQVQADWSGPERVSVSSQGEQGNRASALFGPEVSRNGRYVVYASRAGNLVRGDTNRVADAFIHDRVTGRTRRLSVGPGGRQGNAMSAGPTISADGRYVAFISEASNLVRGDTNRAADVFVWERSTRSVSRVSIGRRGVQANGAAEFRAAISGDGSRVVFRSYATNLVPADTNGEPDLFLRDRERGRTLRVSVGDLGQQANGNSGEPVLSSDGRYLAFQSTASNFVDGDDNRNRDVFLRDLRAGTTSLISADPQGGVGNGGSFNPAISARGRYVAFTSTASSLVAPDTNGFIDAFVLDRRTGVVARVSESSSERQSNGRSRSVAMSRDGRYIAFASTATNLVRAETRGQSVIIVRDQRLGTTQLVSRPIAGVPNGPSTHPMMAGDGWVTYTSQASNLVRGDTNGVGDAFVQGAVPAGSLARLGGAPSTQRISVSSRERQANGGSRLPVTSGRYVVFASDASNLVSGDTNNRIDVFRRDLRTGTTRRISVGPRGRQANGDSTQPVISRDGSIVLFVSSATNLVTGDTNGRVDVYAWENGRTRRVSVSQAGGQSNGDSVQPAISANGNVAAYESTGSNLLPADTNRRMDVYRRRLDSSAASLTLVSVSSDEQQGRGGSFGPVLSATGGVVAFMSFAPNLVADDTNQAPDVFVRTPGGQTERISVSSTGQEGNAASGDPSISADGTVVAFGSNAGNLVGVDDNASRDVFVHDRESGTTRPVSVRGRRTFVPGDSGNASISANGRLIVFTSVARRLVDGDTNGVADIFLRNHATSVTRRVSVGVSGQANGASDDPVISSGGGDVVFSSVASNLVAGDTNRARDVFRRRF